jgi:hypothetical protein
VIVGKGGAWQSLEEKGHVEHWKRKILVITGADTWQSLEEGYHGDSLEEEDHGDSWMRKIMVFARGGGSW